MNISVENDALEYLMAAYYNEDYYVEYGGIWETLEAFLDEDPAAAPPVPALIADALSTHPSDEALEAYLDNLGCAYNTALYPGGARAWLMEISRRVEEWLTTAC